MKYCVEIRIKDYGGDSVEVADNGTGIEAENWNFVGMHPSKFLCGCGHIQYNCITRSLTLTIHWSCHEW